MSEKKIYRKKRLFPRTLEHAMKDAIQPLMNKQGKLYGALLRDWPKIVGAERAAVTKPERLQFSSAQSQEATLHLNVRPAAAPELAYVTEQMLEQCARYFGYRAITRIVIHAAHGMFDSADEVQHTTSKAAPANNSVNLPGNIHPDMQDVFSRIAAHIGSTVVKKDETR